jgi:hypothetical protein
LQPHQRTHICECFGKRRARAQQRLGLSTRIVQVTPAMIHVAPLLME